MSDYRLEFDSMVSPGDTGRLYDLLSIVSEGDELEIRMDNDNPEQINSIVYVLENNSFNVLKKGDDDGHTCHLIAYRIE
jgi:hypothetical protein